ncbi:MAG: DUF1565 domain-containing protein [Polyangiaceae bacterium]|nr:DUF1565 domain-containing protein [Polyangiaceae bacterium]
MRASSVLFVIAAASTTFLGCVLPKAPASAEGAEGAAAGNADASAGTDGAGPTSAEGKCPALAMPTAAATSYVDARGTGSEDGSKAAPFRSLTKALENAPAKGIIWVAAGSYRENLVAPNKSLTIVGGFAAGFASRTDACATVIEAADAAKPVVTAPPDVESFGLDGLTLQKGSRGLQAESDGGPTQGTFTIANAVFADNGKVDAEGGGASFDRVHAKISGSVFRNNRASKGAAVAAVGDVTVRIEGSVFERNIGHADHGGALYLGTRSAVITRSTFRSNEIGKSLGYGWGGAIIVFGNGAQPVKADLSYNVFTDNLASVGGAVFVDDGASVTMSHDLVYRNRAYRENGVARGGAIYVDGLGGKTEGSTLVADHLTVAFNAYDETGAPAAATRGGGVYMESYSKATFTNSIFWKNGDEALFGDPTCSLDVRYAVAPSTCAGGVKCTIAAGVFEPAEIHFVDEARNDYHEKSTAGHFARDAWVKDPVTSPAIDKADPAAAGDAEPMPNGGRANLGAYGHTGEASKSP